MTPHRKTRDAGRHLLLGVVATLGTSFAGAQAPAPAPAAAEPPAARPPIELNANDVFFASRWFRASPSHMASAMCGFAIHGNYTSHDVPRTEWELNIDEFKAGDTPVIAFSGGAFEVVSREQNAPRKPRAPITALTVQMEGEPAPLAARIVGPPSADNAIKALLETAPGQKLLAALYEGRLITVSLTYQDGSAEVLTVRNLQDRGHDSGLSGYLKNCVDQLRPLPPGTPSVNRINSPVELMQHGTAQ